MRDIWCLFILMFSYSRNGLNSCPIKQPVINISNVRDATNNRRIHHIMVIIIVHLITNVLNSSHLSEDVTNRITGTLF